jgi:hypothetical protein
MIGGLLLVTFAVAMTIARRRRSRQRAEDFGRLLGTVRLLLEPPTIEGERARCRG